MSESDRLGNLQVYLLKRNPVVADGLRFGLSSALTNGWFALTIEDVQGQNVTV